jgi:hypothetical protein
LSGFISEISTTFAVGTGVALGSTSGITTGVCGEPAQATMTKPNVSTRSTIGKFFIGTSPFTTMAITGPDAKRKMCQKNDVITTNVRRVKKY